MSVGARRNQEAVGMRLRGGGGLWQGAALVDLVANDHEKKKQDQNLMMAAAEGQVRGLWEAALRVCFPVPFFPSNRRG